MIIGVTGGIATGKSHVSRYLAKHHYRIVDADRITHQVQAKGTPGLRAIIHHFGTAYLTSDRTLNRAKLGRLVFTRHAELNRLVRIIDPYIRKKIVYEINQSIQEGQSAVLDAPTLFENGYQYLVDQIWVVACDPTIQMARLRNRDGFSIHEAQSRMSSQWPLPIKEALADHIINSDGSKSATLKQVKELINR